ncbi:toprim domain-containing protein [Legionella feeleii]|uniref:toprim domain-containing protein n=2 Tax=Legionella feeleii TaxID=453 RepID=UPI0007D0AE33|nr:toprim domain-containing protein [Legionella feeleii]
MKLSKGKIEGSAGILQKGMPNGQVYLAEGIETGASIAMANPKATVLVSFGISNLKNLSELVKRFKPVEVIIAADNDLKAQIKTLEETKKAQAVLSESGLHVTIKMPHSLPNQQKTDWNDVHREKGVGYLKKERLLASSR